MKDEVELNAKEETDSNLSSLEDSGSDLSSLEDSESELSSLEGSKDSSKTRIRSSVPSTTGSDR